VDTNLIAALKLYDPAELPGMMLVLRSRWVSFPLARTRQTIR
jgi:hypothetical protein